MMGPVKDVGGRTLVITRLVQHAIDGLICFAVGVLAAVVAAGIGLLAALAGAPVELFLVGPFVVLAVGMIVASLWLEVWHPHAHGGATLGMRWLGLRVVTPKGGQPSLQAHFLRWLLLVVDGLFFGLVGAVLIAVTPRHQRLGDLVADTLVVRSPTPAPVST